ncbi:hypothetical protein HKCCE2091_20555 [Rhodobacterales bacterium HKCCE2091]|nr:hypothetical protein [Rhodobacterales bacterium HKCCE2091]
MSAPDTDVEKQERRHKPVLVVLRGLIAAAVIALLGYVVWSMTSGGPEAAHQENVVAPAD